MRLWFTNCELKIKIHQLMFFRNHNSLILNSMPSELFLFSHENREKAFSNFWLGIRGKSKRLTINLSHLRSKKHLHWLLNDPNKLNELNSLSLVIELTFGNSHVVKCRDLGSCLTMRFLPRIFFLVWRIRLIRFERSYDVSKIGFRLWIRATVNSCVCFFCFYE